ncbi:hypothetical protein ACIQD1_31310 [Streptomyces sp. NPDC093088]|uniref:hypothetical protein n=1 Tax=Streptomyces sp. NPDC093088 TaxID=3366023 RepID=UPI0038291CEB
MSTLALLVVLLLALVLPLYLGALGYVVLRHPRFAQPLTVCGMASLMKTDSVCR